MKTLYIGSINPFSGKGMLTVLLGLKLKKEGYNVGYIKPLGKGNMAVEGVARDEDSVYAKEVLGLEDHLDDICPVPMSQDLFIKGMQGKVQGLMERVLDSYGRVSRGRDVVLVEGADTLYDGTYLDIPPVKMIARMDAKALIMEKFEHGICADCLLTAKTVLKERMIGVVINQIPSKVYAYTNDLIIPFLSSRGIDVMAALPLDPFLNAVTVRELSETLSARVLCCEEGLDEYVERLSIGAMDVDSAMKYFRRQQNKAVITGGNRSDIQIAALETSTRCLILTGDQNPGEVVLGKAVATGVPILVARGDTLSTIEKADEITGRKHFKGKRKIERAGELLVAHFDYDLLYTRLGLNNQPEGA